MGFLKTVFGWWALLLIAGAIALAQLLGAHTWIRRILWIFAGLFAVAGAINEWGKK